ncbi:MAG: BMP family ABC transporter substrate-binding protein [Chloroflexi bacterium]|nr:BMP family ABC transporter substrate-binding protein [Chloroflexota bacterium]MBI3170884.1 BMP family ABC transporter substrate-binding protein [Chloroflexota bacterium]
MLQITRYVFLTMTCWALTACLSSSDCFREDVFCAALVTDTLGVEDHGINQDAWAGLQEAQNNGLANKVDYIASVDSRDYLKNIAYFADLGYDVIVTSGISLDDETLQSADLAPDSVFVGLNQAFEETRPNLISITFPEDQMGFAAGASAATLTQTGTVAAVCETSGIDAMWRYCEGFREGAQYVNDQLNVLVVYREDGDSEKLFIDEEWGFATALSLIERGADVLFAAGGVTGQGALKAASEFGVSAIGAERDQAAVLGGAGISVVTSFYGQTSFEVQEVMRLIQEGHIPEEREGRVQYVPLSPAYPPEISAQLDALLDALARGEIDINVTNSR